MSIDPKLILQQIESLPEPEQKKVLDKVPASPAKAKAILRQLLPQDRMDAIKEILFEMRTEHISAIREAIESEYQLREHLGEWSEAVLSEAKLEIKKLSYQGSKTESKYSYVYVIKRSSSKGQSVGPLFHTINQHEYRYTLLDNGGIAFSSGEIFKLTSRDNPAQVRLIRLLKLDPPPLDYQFGNKLVIPLHFENYHPQTREPVSRQSVPFPDCIKSGTFQKKHWLVESQSIHSTESESIQAPVLLTERQVQKAVGLLQSWQKLSSYLKSPWYVSISDDGRYKLIHSSGKPMFGCDTRRLRFMSYQSPQCLSAWFEELALALISVATTDERFYGKYLLDQLKSTAPQEITERLLDIHEI